MCCMFHEDDSGHVYRRAVSGANRYPLVVQICQTLRLAASTRFQCLLSVVTARTSSRDPTYFCEIRTDNREG